MKTTDISHKDFLPFRIISRCTRNKLANEILYSNTQATFISDNWWKIHVVPCV